MRILEVQIKYRERLSACARLNLYMVKLFLSGYAVVRSSPEVKKTPNLLVDL